MINALTIDLEDWYQGLASTSQQIDLWPKFEDRLVEPTLKLLNILDVGNVRATFFILGYVADQFPELILRVAEAGHEIALHGYYHRLVCSMTPSSFREEVIRGRDAVEAASDQRLFGFRAPMFSINESALWAFDVLRDLGFLYDSSVFPTRNMLYGYPGAPKVRYRPFDDCDFTEFPMSTVTMMGLPWPISGGIYMRLLPYPIFKRAVQRLNEQGQPLIFYTHPWEFDPNHPRPALRMQTLRERIAHYWGLRSTEWKLRDLLRDFQFGPLIDILDHE